MKWLIVTALKGYRLIVSPLYGQTCRYYPSCSAYALTAVEQLGSLKGSWLAIRRLGRCHPWCAGGIDMVPQPDDYRWWGRSAGVDEAPADPTVPTSVPGASSGRPSTPPDALTVLRGV